MRALGPGGRGSRLANGCTVIGLTFSMRRPFFPPSRPSQFTDAEEEDAADDDDDIEYINLGDKLVRRPRVEARVVSRAGVGGAQPRRRPASHGSPPLSPWPVGAQPSTDHLFRRPSALILDLNRPPSAPHPPPHQVAIRTSTLEEKATACSMIGCYVDELKEGFFPYVKEVRSATDCCGVIF